MNDDYCGRRHPRGWLCLLRAEHEGNHYSVDNRRKDAHGYPGKSVSWGAQQPAQDVTGQEGGGTPAAPSARPVVHSRAQQGAPTPPIVVRRGQRPGYTGIPCDQCGGLNTVRTGTCLACADCNHAGGCG